VALIQFTATAEERLRDGTAGGFHASYRERIASVGAAFIPAVDADGTSPAAGGWSCTSTKR
jgi:hypothetical protein